MKSQIGWRVKLIELGLGPELLAGLYINRGPGFIVGALAILKSGGAILPIDPSFPLDHCQYLIKRCGTLLVVIESEISFFGSVFWHFVTFVEIEFVRVGAWRWPFVRSRSRCQIEGSKR